MTYFHRGNFRHFSVNSAVAPARKEPAVLVETAAEFLPQNDLVEIGEDKNEKVPG